MAKGYGTGYDSGFASDADYEDGFVASDAVIAGMAERQGISHEQAKKRLGLMDELLERNRRADEAETEPDGDRWYGG